MRTCLHSVMFGLIPESMESSRETLLVSLWMVAMGELKSDWKMESIYMPIDTNGTITLKKGGKMGNLEYLEMIKKDSCREQLNGRDLEARKVQALEIIAEEIINLNSTLRSTVTTLENIETALIRG